MSLKIERLSFGYHKDRKILDDISLEVEQGCILGILGPNGTGKTTFIKCVNNILSPDAGQVYYEDKNLTQMKQEAIAKIIAYVPQYNNNLFAMNVVETIMMGRLPYAGRSYSAEDEEIVFNAIKAMGLEKFAFRNINELSGGERQKVFIARAIVQQPKIIILDEPTSSLDLYNQLFILHVISKIAREQGVTIIMTIHDLNLASMFCDKLLLLKKSHVFAYGETQEILKENNIRAMYGVNTHITTHEGYKNIQLVKELPEVK